MPWLGSALKQSLHSTKCERGLPRQFILFSRLGNTDASFHNLHDAGRLDIAYECIVTSLFLSHGIRRDVSFHAILNGPPKPPLHIEIDGEKLYDVRTDVDTWQQILRKVIAGKSHPGISVDKTSFEALLKAQSPNASSVRFRRGRKKRGSRWILLTTRFLCSATMLAYLEMWKGLRLGLAKKLV